MTVTGREPARSTGVAALVGSTIGVGVVAVYLVAGFLADGWTLGGVSRWTVGTVVDVAATGGFVVAGVAVPVTLYLRYRLVTPLAALVAVAIGWFAYGSLAGFLTAETAFGFTLYLFYLAPLFVVLAFVLGGGEYLTRGHLPRGR